MLSGIVGNIRRHVTTFRQYSERKLRIMLEEGLGGKNEMNIYQKRETGIKGNEECFGLNNGCTGSHSPAALGDAAESAVVRRMILCF